MPSAKHACIDIDAAHIAGNVGSGPVREMQDLICIRAAGRSIAAPAHDRGGRVFTWRRDRPAPF
jgi:hypothetical protein